MRKHILVLVALWLVVYAASLFAPPLLDDADATHASAARNIVLSGDYVTLHVNGIRYLEKAPLPYWLVAVSFRLFGFNTFAVHLPQAIAVLLLALLAYRWARRAWDAYTGLYAGLIILTSSGVFLFTRIFIPEVLLSLLLAGTLYLVQRALEDSARATWRVYAAWVLLALAVLTKGLIAIVFVGGALLLWLWLTGEWKEWRTLRPVTGFLLFLAVAAPWHILAGIRNTGAYNGHGFFWFYFVNEHFMRFLGKRIPHDYNKLPGGLYWVLHLVWLFPWSLFFPAAAVVAWLRRGQVRLLPNTRQGRTLLLLMIFAGLILVFFSISTNQEYYTFPAYLPLAILTAAGMTTAERHARLRAWLQGANVTLLVLGWIIAGLLASGLWSSRNLPYVSDIGAMLAHRGVGDYTLSMSHFFDLTGPSFAALRLPAALAAVAFAVGPAFALWMRRSGRASASTLAVAATSAVFLVAAHIALIRFSPMLSSYALVQQYRASAAKGDIEPNTRIMLYGDQAYGSTLPFYLGRTLPLVDGQSTSMWFGSTFPDAPKIFLTGEQLRQQWGRGERKILFVPEEKSGAVDALLGSNQIMLGTVSGKRLITDRPLNGHPR